MIKAIFYKEWIKMRCFYPLSALFLFGATAYALLRVQRVITFKGAAHVWEVMLERKLSSSTFSNTCRPCWAYCSQWFSSSPKWPRNG